VRAAPDGSVRVAALDRETFVRLIKESAATGEELDEVMQARLDTLTRTENGNGEGGHD
jgi:hypothetical protein